MCADWKQMLFVLVIVECIKYTEPVVKSSLPTSTALLILLLLAISNLFETQSFLDIILTSVTVPLPKPQTMSHMEIDVCFRFEYLYMLFFWPVDGDAKAVTFKFCISKLVVYRSKFKLSAFLITKRLNNHCKIF